MTSLEDLKQETWLALGAWRRSKSDSMPNGDPSLRALHIQRRAAMLAWRRFPPLRPEVKR